MLDRDTKFGNTPKICHQGILHQSTWESKRCNQLHVLQKGGLISGLQAHPQPVLRIDINGRHICKVIPDFRYLDENGKEVYEDTKGYRTDISALKKRMALAILGIDIIEVRQR